MAHQHPHEQWGDTRLTKVFVGGLAWETPTHLMRSYFDQFGDILEAVIINDKHTGKSKGYGFVTYRDPESAIRACADPNPVIAGRRANCNIASFGRPRPRPSLPIGPSQVENLYQGSGSPAQAAPAAPPLYRPPPPPLAPVIYPPYGYTALPPGYYGYQQTIYSPQQTQYYNQQVYGAPTSPNVGAPYYYGYSIHGPNNRGTFPIIPPAQRGPSYLYYPEPATSSYAPRPHLLPGPPPMQPFPRPRPLVLSHDSSDRDPDSHS
ncbi:RNA-binding (RRM/RBD/RNP motifs) family protein [Striga hermonthica]|uniref:RNA-binding (RRM/RBD/RNP motifs) family protein n=1 Tax=Striga hermonthica TaxID=68872 RepID=A0A9N7NXT5_STRHE|nr:RNA-binding (RRM/RBD/RNP motifs) family protein [Striga hermonthica]